MKHSLLVTEIDRDWNILKLKLERQELSSEIDNTEELFLLLKELENYLTVIGRIFSTHHRAKKILPTTN
jgi:hypothetical protein